MTAKEKHTLIARKIYKLSDDYVLKSMSVDGHHLDFVMQQRINGQWIGKERKGYIANYKEQTLEEYGIKPKRVEQITLF